MHAQLEQICIHFDIGHGIKSAKRLNSGHINDTFLVTTRLSNQYVLQKLSALAFKDARSVINNKVTVSHFLKQQIKHSPSDYKVLSFIKTKSGSYFYIDRDNNFWNMTSYIPDTVVHNFAPNKKIVYEAGKLYGGFIAQTVKLPTSKLNLTLANFHNVPFRFSEFENAMEQVSDEFRLKAKDSIDFVNGCKKEMFELSKLEADHNFPIRVTHNDAKLSNILFNKYNEGIAVIDLDTVMPGVMLHDFGDSIRSICANAPEDSDNFETLTINLDYYKAFCEGHSESTRGILSPQEIKYLPLAAKTITFIMGLRLLTDYLNHNVYYKVDYPDHNLVRARNQFKLVENIQLNFDTISRITYDVYGFKATS